mmetsp:Transcript_19774/g.60000  ORF Transcript_19774/g.60000 Transcript_19774/m.60000 type:complete len:493 (+) Transcript_19774:103-1581(+)
MQCADSAGWDNHSGKGCAAYEAEYCANGRFRAGSEWSGGEGFNFPERNCCACGKQLPEGGGRSAPAADAPAAQTLVSVARPEVRAVAEERVSTCAARRQQLEPKLLLYSRLPRVGNALMCALLSACSSRQSRTACVNSKVAASAALDATSQADVPPSLSVVSLDGACPGGAPTAYLQYGSDHLAYDNRSMCAGIDGITPACSTFGGNEAQSCANLRALRLPGIVMLQTERYSAPESPPCGWPQAPVAMIALLRDPGERVQSAFHFGLQACVCNFRYQWCKQYTSYRFSNRRPALCDGHKTKPSFYEAVTLLRNQPAGKTWPLQTIKPAEIVGRFAASVVREVYVPYFGSYPAAPAPPDSARPSHGKTGGATPPTLYESSVELAKLTLSNCFAWVGIAEDLPLSLALLKAELPGFFRNLDTKHDALQWSPKSGGTENRTHPYLRTHLLVGDYAVYDAERARLMRRAEIAGLSIFATNVPTTPSLLHHDGLRRD